MDCSTKKPPFITVTRLRDHESQTTQRTELKHWHPIWLRKSVLFSFMALFFLLTLTLILLKHFVDRNQGLSLRLTANHYSWTYGPTVLLVVVVVGLWRRVNYCSMINQPWQELASGPKPADKTVLLDYLSPHQIISFFTAVQNGHYAVAASTLIFALLKIIIVISTTLFLPGMSVFSREVQLRRDTKFDSSLFWQTAMSLNLVFATPENVTAPPPPPGGYLMQSSNFLGGYTYDNISADPVWAYVNLRKEYPNSPPPIELSTAFTNFSIPSKLPGSGIRMSVEVDVVQPNATCEIAEVEWSQEHIGNMMNLTIRTPSCDSNRFQVPVCIDEFISATIDLSRELYCPSPAAILMVERVNCTGEYEFETYLDKDTANTHQYALLALDMDVESRSTDEHGGGMYSAQLQRSVALSCHLGYTVHRGVAKVPAYDTSIIESLDIETDAKKDGIANLTQVQFAEAVISSLQSGGKIFKHEPRLFRNTTGARALLALAANSSLMTGLDPFPDPVAMKRGAEEVLAGVSHQVIRRYFLLPDGDSTTGASIDYNESRLHIRPLVLWAMIGLFILSAVLVLVVILHTGQNATPASPEALLTSALTLSQSSDLARLLQSTDALRLTDMREELSYFDFTSALGEDGCIQIKPSKRSVGEQVRKTTPGFFSRMIGSWSTPCEQGGKRAWVPYPAGKRALAFTLFLPLACIIALEILWHFSETDNSFVSTSSETELYAIRYGSTAMLLLVATIFNALDFTLATFTPFSTLAASKSGALIERSLLFSIVGDLPPVALYKTIRHRHFGAALSLIASAIGSLLTIAVSSLWYVNPSVQIQQAATAEVQSGWRVAFDALNNTAFTSDPTGAKLFNEIQHGITDTNSLVWNDILLPEIGHFELTDPAGYLAVETAEHDSGVTHHYNFVVPALQPTLKCSALPSSSITMEKRNLDYHYDRVNVTTSLPAGCRSVGIHRLDSFTFSHDIDHPGSSGDEIDTQFGYLGDLGVTPTRNPIYRDGCPSLMAVFGINKTPEPGFRIGPYNVTAIMCGQHLQLISADVKYSPTNLTSNATIATELEPRASPELLRDPHSGSSSLSFFAATSFENNTDPFALNVGQDFDNFFSHLTDGMKGTSLDTLLDSDALIANVNSLYQKFMVRILDSDYRVPLSNTAGNESSQLQPGPHDRILRGTSTETVPRLKIDKTSKIVLESLLGVMVVLGGLAYWLVDMRGTLPRNPYPIASRMALFAGSRFLDEIRGEGREKPNGGEEEGEHGSTRTDGSMTVAKELMGAQEGKRFRLGWWNDTRGDGGPDMATSRDTVFSGESRYGIDLVRKGGSEG